MYRKPEWMDEELQLLEDACAKFFEREFAPNEEKWQEQGYVDRSAWKAAGEAGLICASVPEEYGGMGGSFLHEAVILRQQYKCQGTSSVLLAVGSTIVAHYIAALGTEEQKQYWLPQVAAGDCIIGIAMTEPGTGSDLQGVRTTALRDGDDYIINGSKTFISNGQLLDMVIVVARTGKTGTPKDISLFMVDVNDLEGFERGQNLKKLGMKGQDTSELFFNNCRVPASALLGGEEGKGFYQLMGQLPQERVAIAIMSAAMAEKAVEETIAYTKDRKAFGKSIADFQNTRFKLAECATKVQVANSMLADFSARHAKGELTTEEASMAKLWCSEMACEVADECLQLHGGYGYMMEYPVAKIYADLRIHRIFGGTSEIMKEIISRSL